MSRIGKQAIDIPQGVEVSFINNIVTVKSPKGILTREVKKGVIVKVENNQVLVSLAEGSEEMGNFHGLYRSLINNMIIGVTTGYSKILEMIGVGFRAVVQGDLLDLQLGFSHPTKVKIPEGINVKVEKNTVIDVSGIDKQAIGQFAATVRALKKPEPYKGKGIRYRGEYVRKKAGKSGKK